MTKAQLISKLEEFYPEHSTPIEVEDSYNIKRYIVNVFKKGISAKNRVPTGNKANLHFYVYDEGGAGESAYFDAPEIINNFNNDIAGTSLETIGGIFINDSMRQRTLGATLKAANDIINEDPGTANHTERLAWAKSVFLDPIKYSIQMQSFVATNATVQSNGGEATDNDIQYIVNSNINNVAV